MISMETYVLQVKPGYEESAAKMLKLRGFNAMCPVAESIYRSGGQWHKRQKLVFTQYIFVECRLTDEAYYNIKSVSGVVRFLGFGKPEPLPPDEALYIKFLHNGDKIIEASKVYVTGTGEKMILSGLLREYTHSIVSLDLRQRRARVAVTLHGERHVITLPVISI